MRTRYVHNATTELPDSVGNISNTTVLIKTYLLLHNLSGRLFALASVSILLLCSSYTGRTAQGRAPLGVLTLCFKLHALLKTH